MSTHNEQSSPQGIIAPAEQTIVAGAEDSAESRKDLTVDELRLLYELDIDVEDADTSPHIEEIRSARNFTRDMEAVFGTSGSSETAKAMIEAGHGYTAAKYADKFEGLDQSELVQGLIEADEVWHIAEHADKFTGVDPEQLIQTLVEQGATIDLAEHAGKFTGVDSNKIAQVLIEAGRARDIGYNLENFQGLNNEIAQALVESGMYLHILAKLDKFQDPNLVVRAMIEAGGGELVGSELSRIQPMGLRLSAETAEAFIKAGLGKWVGIYQGLFQGLSEDTLKSLTEEIMKR